MEAQKSKVILIICKMGFEFASMYLPSRRLKFGISIITDAHVMIMTKEHKIKRQSNNTAILNMNYFGEFILIQILGRLI